MDPRLKGRENPQKRVASRSPDGAASPRQKRPFNPDDPRFRGSNGQLSPQSRRGSVEVSSGRSTPMSAGATAMANGSASVVEMLMSFTAKTAEIATLQHAKLQAETQNKKAINEYGQMSKHFSAFPATRDTQVAKKKRAEKSLGSSQRDFDQQMLAQRKLAEGIANLLECNDRGPSTSMPAPEVDAKLAKEVEQLHAKVRKLETDLEKSVQLSRDLQADFKPVLELQNKVNELEKGATRTGSKVALLETKYTLLDDAVSPEHERSLATRLLKVEGNLNKLKDRDSAPSQNTQGLVKRVSDLEEHNRMLAQEEREKDEALIDMVTTNLDTEIKKFKNEHLDGLYDKINQAITQESVVAAFTESENHMKETQARVDSLEQQLQKAEDGLRIGVAHLTKVRDDVNTKLDQAEGAKLRIEIDGLKEAARKANAAAANASRTPTPAQQPQQNRQPSLANGVNNGSPALPNGFHPPATAPGKAAVPAYIQGHSGPISTANMHPDTVSAIQGLIDKHDAMTAITRGIQVRIDNLTTDEVAKSMLDQFASIWPYAKDYEHYCRNFHHQLLGVQQQLKTMGDVTGLGGELRKMGERIGNDLEGLKAQMKAFGIRLAEGEGTVDAIEKALKGD